LSGLFGVTAGQRFIRRQDFHVRQDQEELTSGATLFIECIFAFPELEELNEDEIEDAVPEFFLQMAASAPATLSRSVFAFRPHGRMTERPTEPSMKTRDGSQR
jgi:hypothetical protein